MDLKGFLKKHKEQLAYVFWGGVTTLVDWALLFLLCDHIGKYWANAAGWAGAVVFAYATTVVK